MKGHFPGQFPPSDRSIAELWDRCLFVFDANILLNLYRYSDKTRSEFLKVLNSVKKRVWIPHRAAEEFFANRLEVISQQEKAYDETIQTIDALRTRFESSRQHPFVSESTMKSVLGVFEKLKNELTESQTVHTERLSSDPIQEAIAKVFAGRVGDPYTRERQQQIFDDGKERYIERVPPGFKDQSKGSGTDTYHEKCRVYGDLLVWNQILDRARSTGTSVILVTDDKKEDWWYMFNGKTLGPRPELVQEFLATTERAFHMYQADRFLAFANQYLEQSITESALSEIREVRQRREESIAQRRLMEQDEVRRSELENLTIEAAELRHRLASLREQRDQLLIHPRARHEGLSDDRSHDVRAERLLVDVQQAQEIEELMTAVEHRLAGVEHSRRRLSKDVGGRRVNTRFGVPETRGDG